MKKKNANAFNLKEMYYFCSRILMIKTMCATFRKPTFRTDFLFANPSFLLGMGSLMGIFSGYYTFNVSDSEAKADKIAMESDFAIAGRDLYSAFLGL